MTLAAGQPAVVFDQRAYRLTYIDMLRGLAIVIMALDHVRDYPPQRPTPAFLSFADYSAKLE
jgi:uncharacterized membrane protein